MKIVPLLLAAALLSGCSSEPQPAPTTAAESGTEAGESAPSPVETLAGEWRVAGIDGAEFNEAYAITLSIDDDTIDLAACAGLRWTYTIAQGQIETDRLPRSPQEILCRLTSEVVAAGEAIDAASRVERTPSNGIELSGGGHSVLLFSQ